MDLSRWLGQADASLTPREITPEELDASVPFGSFIRHTAQKNGLSNRLLKAQIGVESNFDPNATSQRGARGIAQLMPNTVKEFQRAGNPIVDKPITVDPNDPISSIDAMGRYMKWLTSRYAGNQKKALTAYNMGPYGFDKRGATSKEAQEYYRKVFDAAEKYQSGAGASY